MVPRRKPSFPSQSLSPLHPVPRASLPHATIITQRVTRVAMQNFPGRPGDPITKTKKLVSIPIGPAQKHVVSSGAQHLGSSDNPSQPRAAALPLPTPCCRTRATRPRRTCAATPDLRRHVFPSSLSILVCRRLHPSMAIPSHVIS